MADVDWTDLTVGIAFALGLTIGIGTTVKLVRYLLEYLEHRDEPPDTDVQH